MMDCDLLPTVPPHEHLQPEGTAALLAVLPRLTCLQDLRLRLPGLDTVNTPPQHFSALTASSHLTMLELTREGHMTVPKGAVQHMFPPGRQMPSLQALYLSTEPCGVNGPDYEDWCTDSSDILRISSCCPQLQRLGLLLSVDPEADLSVLCSCQQAAHHSVLGVQRLAMQLRHSCGNSHN
jgi:hypothetical protein